VKAVTICQPYAHLIAIGEKGIENRSWPTSHTGRIAIHAGKSRDWMLPTDEHKYPSMAFGAIVAVATLRLKPHATLRQCLKFAQLPPDMQASEHANGPWCWLIAEVVRLAEPVACRGAQGLWELTPDVEYVVRVREERAA
jgi:activating signal cointegrator 1